MSRFCKFGKLHVTKGNVDKLLGIRERNSTDFGENRAKNGSKSTPRNP